LIPSFYRHHGSFGCFLGRGSEWAGWRRVFIGPRKAPPLVATPAPPFQRSYGEAPPRGLRSPRHPGVPGPGPCWRPTGGFLPSGPPVKSSHNLAEPLPPFRTTGGTPFGGGVAFYSGSGLWHAFEQREFAEWPFIRDEFLRLEGPSRCSGPLQAQPQVSSLFLRTPPSPTHLDGFR